MLIPETKGNSVTPVTRNNNLLRFFRLPDNIRKVINWCFIRGSQARPDVEHYQARMAMEKAGCMVNKVNPREIREEVVAWHI